MPLLSSTCVPKEARTNTNACIGCRMEKCLSSPVYSLTSRERLGTTYTRQTKRHSSKQTTQARSDNRVCMCAYTIQQRLYKHECAP